jgi:hypothetical protein
MSDIDSLVRAYAPDELPEWTPERRDDVLAAIIRESGADPAAVRIPLTSTVAHRRRRHGGIVASVAALTAAAAAIAAVVLDDGDSTPRQVPSGGSAAWDPPAGLSDRSLPDGKYSYRVFEQIELNAAGDPVPGAQDAMVDRNYVAGNGDIVSFRTGSQEGCQRFPVGGSADFEMPSRAFLDGLPTDPDRLEEYLRGHVQGSSSLDEAVFVAVSDALRTADGLASPKLRAAMLAVLSRTPGVTVFEGQRDYLGRPAIRADFVDQAIRPGEVHSLYFDPATFQLTEERFGSNGEPTSYDGPSPAYTAHAEPGTDPVQLDTPAFVTVMRSEQVVDSVPDCQTLH